MTSALSCKDIMNITCTCKSTMLARPRLTRLLATKRIETLHSKLEKSQSVARDLIKKSTIPLHLAVEYGCVDIVQELFQKQDDIGANTRDMNGSTPLMIAADAGSCDAVDILLCNGACIDAVDNDGESALFRASYSGHLTVVARLINQGADLHLSAHDDATPLYIAVVQGNYDVADYLLKEGADPNKGDREGCTPLAIAIREESEEFVELLLNKGADVESIMLDGSKMLHFAIEISSESMVKMLIDKGANIFARNGMGTTAVELANLHGNMAIFRLLNDYVAMNSGNASWG